jgi:hypothetical protein
MPVETVGAIAAAASAEKGLALAEKGIKAIGRQAEKINETLRGNFKILNQEVTVRFPEQVQETSVVFEASGGLLGRKIRFPFGRPNRVRLRPVRALSAAMESAVVVHPEGFELDTKGMVSADTYILDVEYGMAEPRFIDALVQRNTPSESPKDKTSEYWLHAVLKHPSVLKLRFGRLDLRDLDFLVDVGIAEHLKTVVPRSLVQELEAGVALLAERNPHAKFRLGRRHAQAMARRGKGSTMELLGSLQTLFLPDTFRTFVDVKEDFHLGECERGVNFYDSLPIPTWPRSMKVISRTDLSLDNPVAKGVLVYRKDDFVGRVRELLRLE